MIINRDKFFKDGYISNVPIFDKNSMDIILKEYITYLNSKLSLADKIEHKTKSHLLFPWANKIIHNQIIIDNVRSILGEDIVCWNSLIFHKYPESKTFVSMHQDQNYWGIIQDKALSVQIAISESNTKNGCLKILPKSHSKNYKHVDFSQRNNLLARGQSVDEATYSDKDLVNIELKAGDACFFHGNILHGSQPNISKKNRMLFTVRYLTTSNKVNKKYYYNSAVLVNGENNYEYFDLEPKLTKDNLKNLKIFHKITILNQLKKYIKIKIKFTIIVELIYSMIKYNFIRSIYYFLIGKV